MIQFYSFIFFSLINTTAFAAEVGMKADVILTPAGSFIAQTNTVTGEASVEGDTYKAKDIKVDLKTITTGIELRDKHTQKYLETEKYPEAILVNAIGKKGKGKAKINFRGKEKIVDGTYKVLEEKFLQANFKIKISEFDITGVRYMGVGVKDEVKVEIIVPIKKIEASTK